MTAIMASQFAAWITTIVVAGCLLIERIYNKKTMKVVEFKMFLLEHDSALKSWHLAKAKGLNDLDAYKVFYKLFMDALEPRKNNPLVKEFADEIKHEIDQIILELEIQNSNIVPKTFLKKVR